MGDDKIKYEDLISPDDSVKNLIEQLTELNKTYGTVLEVVKTGAKDIVAQLKSMSTATNEGRAEIDEATAAANRLARAQKELKFAMSDTGKEVAWLKSQTASQNKMSIEMQKASAALIGSYDKLKSELKDSIGLWKSLSEAERQGAFGQDLLNDIIATKQRISDLDSQLKVHVQSISAVEKAEQKLAFLRSAEGKRLMELKQLIADEIAANKTKKASLDEVAQAQERLRAAQAASREQAYELNIQAREANRIAKLQAQLNLSEAGSYNQLAAQYELNKIKLNAMSAAERQAEGSGKQLEAETLALYVQMQKLQEATGNHRLSVGNYAKSWDGLGISVSQVVRELPAAAVSMNTFFLGISNNIPILIDEIQKLKAENKELIAQGKQAKSVVGSVAKALFSWNTLLVVGLTILSMHGKAIIDWIASSIKGRTEAIKYADAIDNVNKELEKTNDSYGKNITTIKILAEEWKSLSTQKEQLQWIRDNKTEFDQLDISVRNVSDAENIFVDHTDVIVNALKARAKAAAAMKLAADKYEEALIKEAEAEAEAAKRPSNWDIGRAGISRISTGGLAPGDVATRSQDIANNAEELHRQRVQGLRDEAKAAEATADQYFNMAEAITEASDAELKKYGIDSKHKNPKTEPRGPRQRDLTDQIWRNDLSIRKKYELSLSELQRNEFEKRRIEATDQANQTIREMQEKFRKNQTFLTNPDNKFKPLTPEQKAQIEQQQKEIGAIIENTRKKLEIDLTNLQYEYEVDRNKKLRQVMDWRLNDIAEDIEKEKKLRLEQLEEQESLYTTKGTSVEGGEVVVTGSMSPEEIAKFQREREQIIAEYDSIIYNMKAKSIEAQVELVKKGSEEELALLIHQNEIARQLALAQNKLKPAEERQSESEINAQFNKRGAQIKGQTQMTNFDEAQAAAEAEFNIVKHNENQITIFKLKAEQDRWKQMVKLAKKGTIDWSDAQLKEAEAAIKKLQRQIDEAGNFMNLIKDKGFGGALLTKLGFDDDQIAALSEATNIVLENIKAIADAEVEAAEQAVAAAEKRVEAAQSAYDAEVEGRNNGYANNVATAKKELQQEKKNQAQKEKLLEEAKRRQEAINTVIQASSLITASANLWSSFSSIPIIGPALAIAAIAAMWTSFAVAKVKAAQVTKAASQEYGEGGFEVLEGGSHASGNDIDLQTKNSRGKNMRAEGGEAMAIINKRSTRRYRRMLPALVDSINKGTFEEKFSRAFETGEQLSQNVTYQQQIVDLSQLEEDVKALKRNSEHQYYAMPDGSYIEKKRNVLRRMH
jgi:hypothetical protein